MNTAIAIFVGGGLGSLARYGVSKASLLWFKSAFPMGTLFANVLSCIILALAVGLFKDKIAAHPFWMPMIVIGFCGGFSTFSTFSYETMQLMQNGNYGYAIANIVISVAVCIGLIFWLMKTTQVTQ
jgi:CrcB protein